MARKALIYICIIVFTMFLYPAKSIAETVSKVTVKDLIVKHSVEMGMDPALALSIAKTESNFRHDRKSKHGAIGVFQLMPATARKMGYNPYHLNENIKGGIQYYKLMYKMFGTQELALAAYNAGPGNVRKYKGLPPFAETRKFVASIMSDYNNLKVNPDPAILRHQDSMKEISNVEGDMEGDFRAQHEAILKSYLSNQGI
ncbi:lytic transglycosylase domain-containing protein [bacterium]|nr:lytic transglycosylase domain-containing protein [bacterium]